MRVKRSWKETPMWQDGSITLAIDALHNRVWRNMPQRNALRHTIDRIDSRVFSLCLPTIYRADIELEFEHKCNDEFIAEHWG